MRWILTKFELIRKIITSISKINSMFIQRQRGQFLHLHPWMIIPSLYESVRCRISKLKDIIFDLSSIWRMRSISIEIIISNVLYQVWNLIHHTYIIGIMDISTSDGMINPYILDFYVHILIMPSIGLRYGTGG